MIASGVYIRQSSGQRTGERTRINTVPFVDIAQHLVDTTLDSTCDVA